MILGSLLLKHKETAVHGFVRRSFFIKWDTGSSVDDPVSRKRKNHSAGYAHSARGGHLKSFCATKKAAAQNNVQRPFAILLCTLCALNLGGSGGSSLRRSSLRRSSNRACSSGRSGGGRTAAGGQGQSSSGNSGGSQEAVARDLFHIQTLLFMCISFASLCCDAIHRKIRERV